MSLTKADLIRRLFDAYKNKQREVLENMFTEDFRFTSPYDDAIDKATYFERCWAPSISGWIKEHDLERIFEQGDEAFVTYRCLANDGKEFLNTEFFRFEGDKVREINVYFGATYRNGTFIRQT